MGPSVEGRIREALACAASSGSSAPTPCRSPIRSARRSRRSPPAAPTAGGASAATSARHPFALGARRLALVDVAGGKQPFVRPSGAVLVMNGEVYNHAALRVDLEAHGRDVPLRAATARCSPRCSTARGPDGLAKVEGSYAFAFVAPGGRRLLLGRDPLGRAPAPLGPDRAGPRLRLDARRAARDRARPAAPRAGRDRRRASRRRRPRDALRGRRRAAGRAGRGDLVRRPAVARAHPRPRRRAGAARPGAGPRAERPRRPHGGRRSTGSASTAPSGVFLSGGVDSALVASFARAHGRVPTFTLTFPGHGEVDEARPRRAHGGAPGPLAHRGPVPARPDVLGARGRAGLRRAVRRRERRPDLGPREDGRGDDPRRALRHGRRRGLRRVPPLLAARRRAVAAPAAGGRARARSPRCSGARTPRRPRAAGLRRPRGPLPRAPPPPDPRRGPAHRGAARAGRRRRRWSPGRRPRARRWPTTIGGTCPTTSS